MQFRKKQFSIEDIKKYFLMREDVLMCFIFGSASSGRVRKDSDMDIGIYFKPRTGGIEVEEVDVKYNVDEIWLDVERIVGCEIDLVVLNSAPASIADSTIRGIPVVIKDRGLYLEFMIRVTSLAEDYREFIEDYWRLKQRQHRNR